MELPSFNVPWQLALCQVPWSRILWPVTICFGANTLYPRVVHRHILLCFRELDDPDWAVWNFRHPETARRLGCRNVENYQTTATSRHLPMLKYFSNLSCPVVGNVFQTFISSYCYLYQFRKNCAEPLVFQSPFNL